MKILKIAPGRFQKQYFKVFLEGDQSLKLHEDVVAQFQLQEGLDLPEERLALLREAGERKEALEYAYLFLSYRSRSEKEMSERLRRKGYAPETAQAVVRDLKERRLLDDREFARALAESQVKGKLLGDERVRQDLARKGVPREAAEEALRRVREQAPEDFPDEEERAYQALLKRRRQIKEIDPHTLQRRLFSYLARRGFAYDTIEKALQRYKRVERKGDEEE